MTATQNRVAIHPAAANVGANLINVASGKGGVGKTWLSVTLAQTLARKGKVLLFDGDLGLANVDIQLGLDVQHDLGGVVGGRISMAEAVTPFPEGGFDVLAGKSGSGALADLEREQLRNLREELWRLARRYKHVIVDHGAGVEAAVRSLIPRSGTTLVVATDEPTSLTDSYAFIKLTLQRHADADVRIVINMAENVRAGERTYGTLAKACQNFLKVKPPLAGIVPRDTHVPDSIRRQTALLIRHPDSPAAKGVEMLARQLGKADTADA